MVRIQNDQCFHGPIVNTKSKGAPCGLSIEAVKGLLIQCPWLQWLPTEPCLNWTGSELVGGYGPIMSNIQFFTGFITGFMILLLDLTTNIQYIWIDPMALFDVQISQMPKLEIASKRFRHFSKPCKANRLADAWQPMTWNDMSKGGSDALWNPSHFLKLVIPGILVMLAVKCNLSSNCILRSVNWDLKKPTHPDIYICRASIWKKVSCFFCRPDDVSVSCRSTAMAGAYACHDVCVAVVDNHGPHGILRCNSLSYLLLTGNYPLVPSRRGAMSMSVCSNTEAKKISRRSRPKHCS